MTYATDRGFEIGKLYRVIEGAGSYFYQSGMVVEFVRDDNSACPLFELISGEPARATQGGCYYIDLCDLEPVESTGVSKSNSTKPLLLLYIQQQYPNDKVLKALVESL